MKYRIVHENAHRLRIRLPKPRISAAQEEVLRYALMGIKGVKRITIYRATAGCALEYEGNREDILRQLDAFQYKNVDTFAPAQGESIRMEEVKARRLDPALKRKMRMRILAETAADALLPVPVQLCYHAWQLITLRDI